MPLVKIDLIKGTRTLEAIQKIADEIQEVMREHFNAPSRDRYQIITQHEPHEFICEDTCPGFDRSKILVIIQIFQQGRNAQQKQAAYKGIYQRLHEEFGLSGSDVIITCVENSKADWSLLWDGGSTVFDRNALATVSNWREIVVFPHEG